MAIFYPQKITTTDKTEVTFAYNNYSSMIFTNSHASAAVTIDLYVISQISTDITDTGTNVNNGSGYAITTSSQAVAVDSTTATADVFLNEQVWKSDRTLFGTCTAVHASGTPLTFGAGLVRAMVDDDDLYVGTRHHFLNNVKIPNGASLKLSADEFKFNDTNYKLYIKTDAIGIDIITRY